MRGGHKDHLKYLWIVGVLIALFVLISFFLSNTGNVSYIYDNILYDDFNTRYDVTSTSTFKLESAKFNEYAPLVKSACEYDLDPAVMYDVLIAESVEATYISFYVADTQEDVCSKILMKAVGSEDDIVLAMVNQQPIYLSTVQQRLALLPEGQRTEEAAQQILQTIVDESLLLEEARVRNVTISIEQLDIAYGTVIAENNMTDEQFIVFLEQNGATKEQYVGQLAQQMIINKMLNDAIFSQIEVTDQEVGLYYTQNPKLFELPQRLVFRQILFSGYETEEALVADVNAVLGSLTSEDFCDLVTQYSKDQISAQKCGIYDALSADILPQLRDAMYAHAVNDTFLVQSSFGYHLIVLDGKMDMIMTDFESVKETIHTFLVQQKSQELYNEFISILRSQYLTQ